MRAMIFLLLVMGVFLFGDSQTATEQKTKETVQAVRTVWTVTDSKAYARDKLSEWQNKQWSCLNRLWGKESAWNPKAYNSVRIMGKHAGGIPQLLGLDPKTPPTYQIERGLDYIYYRYGTPCHAWSYWKINGWY
jgi:hypothetical protein